MQDETISPPAPAAEASSTRLQEPNDYRAGRAHIFPSQESFRWFLRNNRAELVEAGALLIPTGRWLVQPDLFDRCLVVIGLRRAAEKGNV
jgi:hypothetical protein